MNRCFLLMKVKFPSSFECFSKLEAVSTCYELKDLTCTLCFFNYFYLVGSPPQTTEDVSGSGEELLGFLSLHIGSPGFNSCWWADGFSFPSLWSSGLQPDGAGWEDHRGESSSTEEGEWIWVSIVKKITTTTTTTQFIYASLFFLLHSFFSQTFQISFVFFKWRKQLFSSRCVINWDIIVTLDWKK